MFKLPKFVLILLLLFPIQEVLATGKVVSDQLPIELLVKDSLLLASDKFGELYVVVGERGHVLYSYDAKIWEQAAVETNVTLTNVFLFDDKLGWAVGHDATILKTQDGAQSWQKVFSAIDEEAPLVDIHFKDKLNGVAIGAYGLVYLSSDGGTSWKKSKLKLIEDKKTDNVDEIVFSEITDLHFNALAFAENERIYIAAEAGNIMRSDDSGKTWLRLPSPYRGSFFGVLPLAHNDVLVYGLRGHLYRSADAGLSWKPIISNTEEMITDAKLLSNGDILATGLAGTMLISKNKGQTFSKVDLKFRDGLAALLEISDGSILLVGDTGITLLAPDKITPQK